MEDYVPIDNDIQVRAQIVVQYGFHLFDALHLACAESGAAEIFLTTDDRLLRAATRVAQRLGVRVVNPLVLVAEVNAS